MLGKRVTLLYALVEEGFSDMRTFKPTLMKGGSKPCLIEEHPGNA